MPILTQRFLVQVSQAGTKVVAALVGTSYDKSVPSMIHYYGRNRREKGSGPYFHVMKPTPLRNTFMTINKTEYLMFGRMYITPNVYCVVDGTFLQWANWSRPSTLRPYRLTITIWKIQTLGHDDVKYNFLTEDWKAVYTTYKTKPDLAAALSHHFGEIVASTPKQTMSSAPIGDGDSWGRISYNTNLDYSSFVYKYNELSTWLTAKEFNDAALLPSTVSSGLGMAYMDAVASLPATTINGLESTLEAINGIIAILRLLNGDAQGIAKILRSKPKDIWLSYRYVYNTTRMDIESLMKYVDRLKNLPSDYTFIKARGAYEGSESSYRVTVSFKREDVIPNSLYELVDSLGLNISAHNIWDIIPYSFVVDWLSKIGPILEQLDAYSKAVSLKPTEVWASYKTFYDGQVTYSRFRISGLKPMIPPLREVGAKTLVYRFVDALSLFFYE